MVVWGPLRQALSLQMRCGSSGRVLVNPTRMQTPVQKARCCDTPPTAADTTGSGPSILALAILNCL